MLLTCVVGSIVAGFITGFLFALRADPQEPTED